MLKVRGKRSGQVSVIEVFQTDAKCGRKKKAHSRGLPARRLKRCFCLVCFSPLPRPQSLVASCSKSVHVRAMRSCRIRVRVCPHPSSSSPRLSATEVLTSLCRECTPFLSMIVYVCACISCWRSLGFFFALWLRCPRACATPLLRALLLFPLGFGKYAKSLTCVCVCVCVPVSISFLVCALSFSPAASVIETRHF